MAKFVYVGDPTKDSKGRVNGPARGDECTFVNATSSRRERVTFRVGEAKEAPKWLEDRLAKHTHFKAVDEKAKAEK